jgi:methionine synthase I (cobalamin-dependent)
MTKTTIVEAVKAGRALVSDGARGTFLQKKGLKTGECPELWCVTHRGQVLEIAQSYVAAGANIIGGCCGTTPAHIAAIRQAVDALRP